MRFLDWVQVLGGIGLLLHGMEMAGANLQLAGGRAMRRMLGGLSRHRWHSAGAGALAAFLVNSSGVTAVVVVGLVGAGLLALGPALAAMAGGGLGSALTTQLLAFHTTRFGPLLIAAGAVLGLLVRTDRARVWSRILLASGLIFLGMSLMTQGLQPVGTSPHLKQVLAEMHGSVTGFLFGLALTVVTGSSSATVAFLMALAQSAGPAVDFSRVTLPAAVGAVLGANVGTCVTPWVASRRGPPTSRQAATTFLAYKLALAACLLPLARPFGDLVVILTRQGGALLASGPTLLQPDAGRLIANLHLCVNVLGVVVLVPLSDRFVAAVQRWLPAPKESESLAPRYLDPEALRTPEVALSQARHEILRFATTVREMLGGALDAFSLNSEDFNRRLAAKDDRVDRLQRAVTDFLSQLMARPVTSEESERAIALIGIADDLESVADVVVRDLLRLAEKKLRLGQDFSPEGWAELKGYHAQVCALLGETLGALDREDAGAARTCVARAEALIIAEGGLRRSHIARLSHGMAESRESSGVHLDILHCLRQIAARLADLNRSFLGRI